MSPAGNVIQPHQPCRQESRTEPSILPPEQSRTVCSVKAHVPEVTAANASEAAPSNVSLAYRQARLIA